MPISVSNALFLEKAVTAVQVLDNFIAGFHFPTSGSLALTYSLSVTPAFRASRFHVAFSTGLQRMCRIAVAGWSLAAFLLPFEPGMITPR